MALVAEGRVVARKYRLERPLARGGMGEVWIARHLQLDTAVAVKFMDPSFAASSDARARFEREAKSSAQLRSPYVATVHDYGVEDDTPYIVMELLEGEDLSARLRREGRLTLTATTTLVTQVCRALRRAHEMGIVHRDLKPGNIFLARHDEEEIVKVLDFGIAKAARSTFGGEATKTGTIIGSPHYMSPEQSRSTKQVDHRSDLWSLGVIAYRSLTGQLPIAGTDLIDVLVRISTDPIPAPSHIAPELGVKVDPFFERALARDPAARFQSAREMAEAFAALTGTRTAMSYPAIEMPIAAGAAAAPRTAMAAAAELSEAELAAEKTAVLSAAHPVVAYPPGPAMADGALRAARSPIAKPDPDSIAPAGKNIRTQAGHRHTARAIMAFIGGGAVLLGSAAVGFFHFASPAPTSEVSLGAEPVVRSNSPSAGAEPNALPLAVPNSPTVEAGPPPGARDEAVRADDPPVAQAPAPPGGEKAASFDSKAPDPAGERTPKPPPARATGLVRTIPWDYPTTDTPKLKPTGESTPLPAPRTNSPPSVTKKPNFGI